MNGCAFFSLKINQLDSSVMGINSANESSS